MKKTEFTVQFLMLLLVLPLLVFIQFKHDSGKNAKEKVSTEQETTSLKKA